MQEDEFEGKSVILIFLLVFSFLELSENACPKEDGTTSWRMSWILNFLLPGFFWLELNLFFWLAWNLGQSQS